MCVRAKRNSSDSSYFLYSGSISWNGILSLYSNASNKWSSLFRALLTSSSSWVRSMILRTVSYFCSISLNARHDVTEIWNQFYSKLSKFGFWPRLTSVMRKKLGLILISFVKTEFGMCIGKWTSFHQLRKIAVAKFIAKIWWFHNFLTRKKNVYAHPIWRTASLAINTNLSFFKKSLTLLV